VPAYCQGVSLVPGGLELTNALDITIGTF